MTKDFDTCLGSNNSPLFLCFYQAFDIATFFHPLIKAMHRMGVDNQSKHKLITKIVSTMMARFASTVDVENSNDKDNKKTNNIVSS